MAVRRSRNGFVLIATTIALTLLLALAALAIDLGRMYVIRAELQTFADAAALSAAMQLDGSASGLASARTSAARLASGPHAMRWDMGTQSVTNIAASFSADGKTWEQEPKQPGAARFVRIVVTEPAPVIFLRIFEPATSKNVAAAGVAANTQDEARLIQ